MRRQTCSSMISIMPYLKMFKIGNDPGDTFEEEKRREVKRN